MEDMAEHLFLITGGGTGAKVAEAYIHLCATGLGPRHVHVLFIDVDTVNGNLRRALETGRAYGEMQRWPWSVQTTYGGLFGLGGRSVGFGLFASRLHLYELANPVEATHEGGIRNMVRSEEMRQVLDLLYDAEEQEAPCDDGFRSRPNLGCLLLAEHLNARLPGEGRAFLEALQRAASAGEPVPVVVAASVFGGTGASLLPIVRGCVEQALEGLQGRASATERLRWGAVKMLPHYQPSQRKASVDPDRYLLDAAGALQFYSAAQRTVPEAAFEATYLVGSDKPSRNVVKSVIGQTEQVNPAYFEEFVGALAVQHFADTLSQAAKPVRLFDPAHREALGWDHLPHRAPRELRTRFAYLLHLGAFLLRQRSHADTQDLAQGLAALLRNSPPDHIHAYPWYKRVLDAWATHDPRYANMPGAERPRALLDVSLLGEQSVGHTRPAAANYFGRLLLWADSAFKGDALGLVNNINDDYAALYTAMSKLKAADVDAHVDTHEGQTTEPERDNALIRLLRSAATALARDHMRADGKRARLAPVPLIEDDGRIGLRITAEHVRKALEAEHFAAIDREYIGTAA